MGMYTEFHYNAELKQNTPDDVLEILRFMVSDREYYPPLPSHELFQCYRWKYMLSSDSYYFDADTHSTLRKDETNDWYLCIRCNLKNYNHEIEKFCDWIRPYIDKVEGEFLGFSRYEEDEVPTLIYA